MLTKPMLRWEGRLPQRVITACTVGVVIVAGGVSSAGAAALRVPKHRIGHGTSGNWSGYAVDGTGATQVTGSWIEPAVSCAAGENSWSSPWVGIDGDNSSTVEQTGTDSDCRRGKATYYAWYEMYPKSLVTVSMAVHPGDSITGAVTYSGNAFTLKLTDNTTRASFSTTESTKKAARSSVEWIMEGPADGLLSDFGSVAVSGASATIDGHSAGLSSLAGAQPLTMVNSAGVVRAQPSSVSANAFGIAWKHS